MRYRIWIVAVVAMGATCALAAEPCPLAEDQQQAVTVELTVPDPDATLVAGATLVVDHPEQKLGIPGEGIKLPKGTLTDAPADAIASANDLGDAVRIVIARPGPLPVGRPLFRLHFDRCKGAAPATAEELQCRVVDAADPFSNKLHDVVGCRATTP